MSETLTTGESAETKSFTFVLCNDKLYEYEIDENGIAIGRTWGDAPEIDGDVIIETSQPEPGHFYRVKIVDAIGFDLIGEVINESTK